MPIPKEKLTAQYWKDQGYHLIERSQGMGYELRKDGHGMIMDFVRRDNILELAKADFDRIIHFACEDDVLYDMMEQVKVYYVLKYGLKKGGSSEYLSNKSLGFNLLKEDIKNGLESISE